MDQKNKHFNGFELGTRNVDFFWIKLSINSGGVQYF